jgi:hypothetical protein
MVTVPPQAYSTSLQAQLRHLAHIALQVQSVSDDSQLVRLSTEPQSCCGLMRLSKFSLPGMLTLPVSEPMLLMVCFLCLVASRMASRNSVLCSFMTGQCHLSVP